MAGPGGDHRRRRSLRWRAVARILIVGGGCPGRELAARLIGDGHAVRITTREERGRAEIERSGAECWIGTPDRLASMRGALDHVTIACWMLAGARGELAQLRDLHGSRLEFFLSQAIDTTVRGFLYDATPSGEVSSELLGDGTAIVKRMTELNAIPVAVLEIDRDGDRQREWVAAAAGAIERLLSGAG
jgi:hypothetical protein